MSRISSQIGQNQMILVRKSYRFSCGKMPSIIRKSQASDAKQSSSASSLPSPSPPSSPLASL
eukprot:10289724-Karenia_brevis.AAC.1